MTDEGIAEMNDLMNNKSYYVNANGRLVFSANNDISKLVFMEMTA